MAPLRPAAGRAPARALGRAAVAVLAGCLGVGAGVAASTGTAGAVTEAREAPAAAAGACPTLDDGVTVVVDFRGVDGRGTVVRCAPGSPKNGYAVLRDAGFTITVLPNGFVCRIDGLPAPPGEPCQGTGAASTELSWSYSLADRGGAWSVSGRGADRTAVVGSVEGWTLAAGATPSVPPPPPPPPPTTASPTTAPPPAAPPTAPAQTAPAPTDAPRDEAPAPPQSGPAPPVGGAPDGMAGADDDARSGAADPPDPDVEAAEVGRRPTTTSPRPSTTTSTVVDGELAAGTRSEPSGGPGPTGALVAGVLMAGLAAAALVQARRRARDPVGDEAT